MTTELASYTLGVVTVTFNADQFIDEFISCCFAQTHTNFKLLIIDNCSVDSSVRAIKCYDDPRLELLVNTYNVGYAEACNQAIDYFKNLGVAEVLFINNDTRFKDALFASLIITRNNYQADAVTPRIVYASEPSKNWYAGGRFNYWRGFQGEHIGEGLAHNTGDVQPRFTEVAPGCCILFGMHVFNMVGNFDPIFFVYFEDTDLFIRMRKMDKTLLYHPGIVLEHKVSLSTGGPQSDFSIYYYHRNQIYLIRKHLNVCWLPIQLIIIFLKVCIRLILRMDNFRQFRLRIKGIFEGFYI